MLGDSLGQLGIFLIFILASTFTLLNLFIAVIVNAIHQEHPGNERPSIEGELARVNKEFARVEQVKKFRLIEQKLGAEDEELTPTMKLKRKFVNQKYADLIESMYRQ